MEQAQCWMWTKQKQSLSPKKQESTTKRSYEDVSWEEQAFAEDAAGPLGGCIWPPRSYSCSFCRREFRSAQALGGHMNVHRRDRARLKQSASPHNEFPNHQDNHNHVQYHPCTSFGGQYPSPQVCALVYNPNPNSDFNSRVSAPSTKDNCGENTLVVPPPSPRSWSNFVSGRYSRACASDSKSEEDKKARIIESGCRATADYVKPDLSVCLNLLVCRKRPTMSDEEEDSFSSKRKRTDASPLPFFLNSSSSEALELSPSSLEDLDLELRLGDPPQGTFGEKRRYAENLSHTQQLFPL